MKLIGRPLRFELDQANNTVRIPLASYHRVALGLESETQIYLAPMPPANPSHLHVNEILVSTFRHDDWPRLHRLQMRLKERTGVIADALKIVKDHTNICLLESLTTRARSTHDMLLYVNVTPQERAELQVALAVNLRTSFETRTTKTTATESLAITQLRKLTHCADPRFPSTFRAMGIVRTRSIECKYDDFANMFALNGQAPTPPDNRVLIYSDTEEKCLQLYFPQKGDCLLTLAIAHKESQGAIYSFASKFRDEHFNILADYSRLQSASISAFWKVTAEIPRTTTASALISTIIRSPDSSSFAPRITDVGLSYDTLSPSAPRQSAGYSFAGGQDLFYGRSHQISTFLSALRRGLESRPAPIIPSTVVRGFSKCGKTALFEKLIATLYADPFITERVVVISVCLTADSLKSFWRILAEAAASELRKRNSGGASTTKLPKRADPPTEIKRRRGQTDYEQFIDSVAAIGIHTIVFVDEAHLLLHARVDSQAVALEILQQIGKSISKQHVPHTSTGASVSWVLADKLDYLLTSQWLEPGLHSRFTEISVGAFVDHGEAHKLIVEPFGRIGVHFENLDFLVRRISEACGKMPCYIQAVCSDLNNLLFAAPPCIDVFSLVTVEESLRRTAADTLKQHFAEVQKVVLEICDPKELRRALRRPRKSVHASRLVRRERRTEVEIGALPVIHAAQRHGHVRFNELFVHWLRASGVLSGLAQDAERHGREMESTAPA